MSTAGRYRFIGDCVSLRTVEDLDAMIDNAVPISRAAFCKKVDREDREAWEAGAGYALNGRSGLLTATRDYHIAYYRSTWRGTPCVYMVWSAYEIVFTGERRAA